MEVWVIMGCGTSRSLYTMVTSTGYGAVLKEFLTANKDIYFHLSGLRTVVVWHLPLERLRDSCFHKTSVQVKDTSYSRW